MRAAGSALLLLAVVLGCGHETPPAADITSSRGDAASRSSSSATAPTPAPATATAPETPHAITLEEWATFISHNPEFRAPTDDERYPFDHEMTREMRYVYKFQLGEDDHFARVSFKWHFVKPGPLSPLDAELVATDFNSSAIVKRDDDGWKVLRFSQFLNGLDDLIADLHTDRYDWRVMRLYAPREEMHNARPSHPTDLAQNPDLADVFADPITKTFHRTDCVPGSRRLSLAAARALGYHEADCSKPGSRP